VLTSYVESRFLRFSSGSFRDLTRVSGSPAYLWSEIFLSNRSNILKDIRGFLKSLDRLRITLERKDSKGLADFIKKVNLKHKKAL
jgi:prephenate dehydrogenase